MEINTSEDSEFLPISRLKNGEITVEKDSISSEIPLAIEIEHRGQTQRFSNTLCSPSFSEDLAVGLMWSEGLFHNQTIEKFNQLKIKSNHSIVSVSIEDKYELNLNTNSRLQSATPSCGWCGKTSVDDVMDLLEGKVSSDTIRISPNLISKIVNDIRSSQKTFTKTGGVHASAIVDSNGNIQYLREDVGRHNSVDKVIGSCIRDGINPGSFGILSLSGRAGIELIHKAAMANFEIVIAVGAPTTLAIDIARSANITLVGFVKNNSMNIYTYPHRIQDND